MEFSPKKLNNLLKILDKILQKFISLPFYLSNLTSMKNLKTLINSDKIIMVSESVGCSAMIILFLSKLLSKNESFLFVMGLYSKKIKYKNFKFFHNFLIKLLHLLVDKFMFLGIGELRKAEKFHKSSNKLIYFPFSIDTDFWNNDSKSKIFQNNKLVFVGNDGNRNQELLLGLVEEMKEYRFQIVSSLPKLQNINFKNVETFRGYLGNKNLTDSELKKIYLQSRMSLIPLKESSQPSGQSVALQSMSLGIPVVISKTSGFWDDKFFKNYENIIFVEENSIENWKFIIEEIYNDDELLKKISRNAKKLVNEKFGMRSFDILLKKEVLYV